MHGGQLIRRHRTNGNTPASTKPRDSQSSYMRSNLLFLVCCMSSGAHTKASCEVNALLHLCSLHTICACFHWSFCFMPSVCFILSFYQLLPLGMHSGHVKRFMFVAIEKYTKWSTLWQRWRPDFLSVLLSPLLLTSVDYQNSSASSLISPSKQCCSTNSLFLLSFLSLLSPHHGARRRRRLPPRRPSQ